MRDHQQVPSVVQQFSRIPANVTVGAVFARKKVTRPSVMPPLEEGVADNAAKLTGDEDFQLNTPEPPVRKLPARPKSCSRRADAATQCPRIQLAEYQDRLNQTFCENGPNGLAGYSRWVWLPSARQDGGTTIEVAHWSDEQNDLIVAEYFAMLDLIMSNQPFVKQDRKRLLDAKIQRGIGSIDFKLGNISAVASELGLPELPGFAPAPKAQKSIADALRRYLTAHPERFADGAFVPVADIQYSLAESPERREVLGHLLTLVEAPEKGAGRKARPPFVERLIQDFDPAARDQRNRVVGKAGEQMVFDYEIARLTAAGKPNLAGEVQWTSRDKGDGAGYDIRSFNLKGEERFIEVKSTKGSRTAPFYLSRNEREVSVEHAGKWRLHRVFDLSIRPKLFRLKPPLEKVATLEPEAWSVWLA